MGKLKFLCVCAAGTVRSGALAFSLKYNFYQDAVTLSHECNEPEVFALLSKWADHIILLRPYFIKKVPVEFYSKVRVMDIGTDRWGNPLNKELQNIVSQEIQRWASNNWVIDLPTCETPPSGLEDPSAQAQPPAAP